MQHDEARHLLPAQALGELPADQVREIEEHLERCPICREELVQMQQVLDMTAGLEQPEITDDMATQAGQMVLEAIEIQNLTPEKPTRPDRPNVIRWVMVTAVLLLLLLSILIWTHLQRSSVPLAPAVPQQNEPAHPNLVQSQLENARNLFERKNITGLLALLEHGESQTQVVVANDLARLEATEALPLLNRLTATWQGDPNDNPFAQAAKTIRAVTSETNKPVPPAVTAAKPPNDQATSAAKRIATARPEGQTVLPPRGRVVLSGQVVDPNGLPVPEARVRVSCWQHAGPTMADAVKVTTDPNGRFQLIGPAGTHSLELPALIWASLDNDIAWTVLMSKDQRESIRWEGRIPGSGGNLVYDGTDQSVKVVDIALVMGPSVSLAGVILDPELQPIARAQVTAVVHLTDPNGRQVTWGSPPPTWVTTSTAQGEYLLHVPPLWPFGRIEIHAQASGFVTETRNLDSQEQEDQPQNLELRRQGPTVKGTLLDNYGTPVGNCRVGARVHQQTFPTCQDTTDENGHFELKDCPSDLDLNIIAYTSQDGVPGSAQSRAYYPDVNRAIPQAAGQSEVQVEMIAILPELDVEVQVVDEQGNPMEDYPVSLDGNPGAISPAWRKQAAFTQRTDSQGHCHFSAVPDIDHLHLDLDPKHEFPQYRSTETPIDVVDGQMQYSLRVVAQNTE